MKRNMLALGCLVLAGLAFAQDDPSDRIPSDPEIILPPVLLQIEDVTLETLEVALPPTEEILAPEIGIPLPRADEPGFIDLGFEVPLLDGVDQRVPTVGESSIFSNGTLGVGTMNHIVGSVSLFKLGDDPRFRFRFSHEGIDGYNFRDPGTGYFFREDIIDGWFAASTSEEPAVAGGELASGELGFDIEGAFREEEEGLQGQSDYYSVDLRFLRGGVAFGYRPEEIVLLRANVDAAVSTRLLTLANPGGGGTAPREEEVLIEPAIGVTVDVGPVLVYVDAGYDLRVGVPGDYHGVRAEAGFEAAFDIPLFLDGFVGVDWNTANLFSVPFELGINGIIDDVFTIGARGGLDVRQSTQTEYWESFPLAAAPAAFPAVRRWHAGVDFSFQTGDQVFRTAGGLVFDVTENALSLGAYDPATDLYPTSRVTRNAFHPRLSVELAPSRAFSAGLEWVGTFLDLAPFEPASVLALDLGLRQPDGDFGGSLSTRWSIYAQPTIPELSLGGFWKVSEGVEFQLDFEDILAPLYPQGRLRLGNDPAAAPFVTPGFRASLRALIAL